MRKLLHKKVIIIACVCALLVVCGVIFVLQQHKKPSESDIAYVNWIDCVSSKGFYHQKCGDSDSEYYFFDFVSHKNVLLSNRPNATIKDAQFPETPLYLAYYRDKLYAFGSGANKASICCADADGSNKTKFVDVNSNINCWSVIANNKIYYPSTIMENSDGLSFGAGDTKNASVRVIDLDKKTDSALTKVREGVEPSTTVIGAYKNKLFYCYNDLKEIWDTEKFMSTDVPKRQAYIRSNKNESSLYQYDLETGEEIKLPFFNIDTSSVRQNGDSIYYLEYDVNTHNNTLYRYNIDTGKTAELYSDKNMTADLNSIGNYIIYSIGEFNGSYVELNNTYYLCYDINSGKTFKVNNQLSSDSSFNIEYAAPNGFICCIKKDEVNHVSEHCNWGYISSKDLFGGKLNFDEFN